MTLCWAAENPHKIAAFAGIYPVCNLTSHPGLDKAAGAYHLTEAELAARLAEHNPPDRLAPLAKAGVPLFAIHGDSDHGLGPPDPTAIFPSSSNSRASRIPKSAASGQGFISGALLSNHWITDRIAGECSALSPAGMSGEYGIIGTIQFTRYFAAVSHHPGYPFRMFPGIKDLRMAKDFQSLARRVVHCKEGNPVIYREVADADHLSISAIVGKHQLMRSANV